MTPLDLALTQTVALDLPLIAKGLFLSLLLGGVIAGIYRFSLGDRLSSQEMQASMVLLSMITAMIMMVIGNNIARSFALVGALAIIRFRTRLRSPWDISFVFFALAAGIACGVFAWSVAVLGTGIIGLAVLVMQATPWISNPPNIHVLRCDLAAYQQTEEKIGPVLDRHLARRWLDEARALRFGETLSYRYRIVLRDENGVSVLLRELSEIEGVERVVFTAEDDPPGAAD